MHLNTKLVLFLKFLPKYRKLVIECNDSFDKVVIVDTADKVGQEISSDFWINAGEQKL